MAGAAQSLNFKKILKSKKRGGVGERAPFLISFMIILQLSFAAVNSLNIFSYSIPVNTTQLGLTALNSAIQCTTYTVGTAQAQCNPSVGNEVSAEPNILVFGDWFRGLTIIYQFFTAILLPGLFLTTLGLPPIFAAVFTAGFYIAWLWLIIWIITGRPT
jgi:hypothetical protein